MWIRFVLYGLGGWCGEVLFTGLSEGLPRRDWRLLGTTYLWMFPIYGSIAIIYEPVHDLIRDFPWMVRAVIWAIGFMAVEWVTGWLIARDQRPMSLGLYGCRKAVRYQPLYPLGFFPCMGNCWSGLEPIHDFLVRLTPFIELALRGG